MLKSPLLALTLLACQAAPVQAAEPAQADKRIRLLAATCISCHGQGGHSLGAVPSLAGQDKAYLQTAMMECKTGARETTVMRRYMNGFTDEEITKLAEYFSNLK